MRQGNEPWWRRMKPWLRIALSVGLVTAACAGSMMLVLRRQWDVHLERTMTWYEAEVGSLDAEHFRRPPLPEGENLGTGLRELVLELPLSASERDLVDGVAARTFGLHRTAIEASESRPVSPFEWQDLEDHLQRRSDYLARIDAWTRLEKTGLGIASSGIASSAGEIEEWLLGALGFSRLSLARAALALRSGDCTQAVQAAVAVERASAALGAEMALPPAMLSAAIEADLLELLQHVYQAQLEGRCVAAVDVAAIDLVMTHHRRTRLKLGQVLAGEGVLIVQSLEGRPSSWLEGWGGRNFFHMASESLEQYASLALEADGRRPAVPRPNPPFPSSRFRSRLIADMLTPNLQDLVSRESRAELARRLTLYVGDLARHDLQGAGSRPPLPRGPAGESLRATREGGAWRLTFADLDSAHVGPLTRDDELLTVRLPERYGIDLEVAEVDNSLQGDSSRGDSSAAGPSGAGSSQPSTSAPSPSIW